MLKILVVDDNQPRVELIKIAFAGSKLSGQIIVTACDSADAAREELCAFFDILILDILLPKKSNGIASATNSKNLLSDIYNPKKPYLRPGLTVGLTADTEFLHKHQQDFLKNATVVLNGSTNNIDWLDTLLEQVDSVAGSKLKAAAIPDRLLITVHGIRTYGKWQASLQRAMRTTSREFDFVDVKYGFFDLLSFSIPLLRLRKAREAALQLINAINNSSEKKIYIVAHSFGTLVVSEALKMSTPAKKISRIIFCGSPISHKSDLSHIQKSTEFLVNDCGSSDAVLILARVALWGLGDAGRVGFNNSNSSKFINRHFRGGHSLYFKEYKDNAFYTKYWTPLLADDIIPEPNDDRSNYFGEDIIDIAIKLLTSAKPFLYISGLTYSGWWLARSIF